MQKAIFGGVLILCALSAQTQTKIAPAIYIGAADIQATLKKAPADSVSDQAIRTVSVGNLNVGVGVVHRSAKAAQTSIAHDELTEIYHILAGSGTLVTGGTLTKPERFPPDSQTVKELAGPSMRGTGLDNGVSRTVRAGDVVIIPAGTGHWFSSIDGTIDYEVMRVDPGKLLSLK
jgi:mannose-6-phosphate isomerase-like protein (cupin superfamily)